MEGMSDIQFDVSTSHPEARKFFNQGVAQLHGFWYYEAERSFGKQPAWTPTAPCVLGHALANVNNTQRASALIAQAVQRKANASVANSCTSKRPNTVSASLETIKTKRIKTKDDKAKMIAPKTIKPKTIKPKTRGATHAPRRRSQKPILASWKTSY